MQAEPGPLSLPLGAGCTFPLVTEALLTDARRGLSRAGQDDSHEVGGACSFAMCLLCAVRSASAL